MRHTTFGGLVLALALAASPVSSQAVVETHSAWDGSTAWYPFGSGDVSTVDVTDAYGQTFTAPAQYLNSWSFWARSFQDGDDLTFEASIGTWTGSSVGSVLWTSGVMNGTASNSFQEYAFNTGGVSLLTGGEVYIFFLNGLSGSGTMWIAGFPFGDNPYPGGSFNYNNGTDHTLPWDGLDVTDLAFVATFDRVPGGPGSTVPEPATMTLLATGLAGMAASRRRKQ